MSVGSNLFVALPLAVLLGALSVPIARRVARGDSYSGLQRVIVASAILHLLCAPAQIFVVDHFYNGVADWVVYVHQGSILASNWRVGRFTFAGSGVTGFIGDGAISTAAGIVMTVVGADQLAAFFVFAWLAFVGTVFFYRAFAITFPEANRRRYALLLFFLPSILFWTADVSKEALVMVSLGLAAYGMALVLARQRGGYPLVVLGGAIGLFARPDQLVLLVVGFAITMLWRSPGRRQSAPALRVVVSIFFAAAVVVVTGIVTARLIHTSGAPSLVSTLDKIAKNNQGSGFGFGSSLGAYSANPIFFPRDVYNVLFNPLPFNAHGAARWLAAAENTVLLVLIVLSLPRLRMVVRACRQRPYVVIAVFYSLAFIYAFTALGNLGLIIRERTLLLPLLMVPLAIPVAPKGEAPYPWQIGKRPKHKMRSDTREATANPVGPSTELVMAEEPWGAAEWSAAAWSDDWGNWAPGEWEQAEWSGEESEVIEAFAREGPGASSDV